MTELRAQIERTIRDIPDFPKPGILFKDITPLLQDGPLFAATIEHLRARYAASQLDAIVGVESRGYIFGAPLAAALGVGFVPVRKPGKLPAKTIGVDYGLEYGTDRLEMHVDALSAGQRVLLIDDLLATGGTAAAGAALIRQVGGQLIEVAFIIELAFLEGRARLAGHEVYAMLSYS